MKYLIIIHMCPHCNPNAEMILPLSTVCWIVAAAVLATLITSWFIFRKQKFNPKTLRRFCLRIEKTIENCEDWFSGHWVTLLFLACTIFVVCHFEKCLTLKFTAEFNGYNTIFLFWLILLVLPLFEKFEISGFRVKTRKQARIAKTAYDAAMIASDSNQTLNAEQLEELHKNGSKDE